MSAKKMIDDRLDRLDTFVLAGVITVLATRGILYLTGFPQLGTDTLHIAHVLWGGLFMLVAFLLLLLGDQINKILVAVIGGIGFGLFIDEIGKFITKDNDYFYQPAFTVMYILFLAIWFLSRLIIVRKEKQDFLSPAEWPRHRVYDKLIIGWIILQVLAGVVIYVALLGTGFGTVNDFLDITGLGVISAMVYVAFLAFGLYRHHQGNLTSSAHIIRGATIFAILVMYPFIFYNYPKTGIVGMLITVPVTIGLSQVSMKGLLHNIVKFRPRETSK